MKYQIFFNSCTNHNDIDYNDYNFISSYIYTNHKYINYFLIWILLYIRLLSKLMILGFIYIYIYIYIFFFFF